MNFSKFSSTNDTLGSLNGVCILTKGYYARPQYSILKHMWGLQVHDDCKTYLYYIYCQVKHLDHQRNKLYTQIKMCYVEHDERLCTPFDDLSLIYLFENMAIFSFVFLFFLISFFFFPFFSLISFLFFLFAQPMSLFARLLERDESNFVAWSIFIWLQQK